MGIWIGRDLEKVVNNPKWIGKRNDPGRTLLLATLRYKDSQIPPEKIIDVNHRITHF